MCKVCCLLIALVCKLQEKIVVITCEDEEEFFRIRNLRGEVVRLVSEPSLLNFLVATIYLGTPSI